MDRRGIELLERDWQNLVQRYQSEIRAASAKRLASREIDAIARHWALQVDAAYLRLKHAEAQQICRESSYETRN